MCAGHVVRKSISLLLFALPFAFNAWAGHHSPEKGQATSTSRWEEGQPGCTFSRDDDGKYRYGFWTADFGIVLAVDSQELEKTRRRAPPIFGLLLTIHYRGKDSLDVEPGKIVLEFVKHYHAAQSALDPDNLAKQEQSDAATLVKETEHEVRKHPEKREEKEAVLAARQTDAVEMIEFLKTRSLPPAKLDPGYPEASGWVLFSTKSKWIDDLHKQEEFVLRVPLGDRIVEFPFALPPSEGDMILRSRPKTD